VALARGPGGLAGPKNDPPGGRALRPGVERQKKQMAQIRIPLASPAWEYEQLKAGIDAAVGKALADGKYILGPEVGLLEKEAASYLGAKHAVGMSSGTDALLAALMALGVGPGSEVVTTAFSFIATSSVIARLGARPVFVDLEEGGFNMDAGWTAGAITKRTRAIIAVHLFGQPADMDAIMEAARGRGVGVIEDCAQAFGALAGTRKAGTIGDLGCYSFFPAKPLGGAGDGGLVVCAGEEQEKHLRMLRAQGASGKNVHPIVGGNFRLDTLQAAVLRVKLPALDGWIDTRRRYAQLYRTKLGHLEGAGKVALPAERDGTRCVWAQFSIMAKNRDALQRYLAENGIGCEVYYPMPLPRQESMKEATGGGGGSFPRTEKVCREVLSIPIHPCVSPEQVEEVAQTVVKFYTEHD
jgi:dTDP-4-amino-4,6-dideoxygalactose transaminase